MEALLNKAIKINNSNIHPIGITQATKHKIKFTKCK